MGSRARRDHGRCGEANAATRILLAIDHRMFRGALRCAIDSRADLEVVGEAADGRSAVEAVKPLGPDLVIMNLLFRQISGIEATREIVGALGSATRVLILARNGRPDHVALAMQSGATGYAVQSAPLDELFEAIACVSHGRTFVSPAVAGPAGGAEDEKARRGYPDFEPLTFREHQILGRVAEGLGTREIAASLHISASTVNSHRANLMRKLGVNKTVNLIRLAIREGFVSP